MNYGRPGPSSFDLIGMIENWVEHGTATDNIVASRNNQDLSPMTRPLCRYPELPKWKGPGSTFDAANFVFIVEEGIRSATT